ncbi:MAG: nucleoside-diphosphate kinase [Acidobacteria bacterium]|nr:nucleoside-diphosphate kinase [Acidobacteriota bacterium]
MAEQTGKLIWGGKRTFGIIKPDAVRDGKTGAVLQRITDGGFKIRAMKLVHMTKREAEGFYDVHRERPFFGELTQFMSSGPCVVLALEREGAVKGWRDLMGATDPGKADEGTLRKEFGGSLGENAVHGSDSEENAAIEVSYFFSRLEMV